MATSRSIQANLIKNSIVQSILLVSALLYEHLLLPATSAARRGNGARTMEATMFTVLWLCPFALLSLFVSGVGNIAISASLRPHTTISYHARSLSTFLTTSFSRSSSAVDFSGLTATALAESYRVILLINYFLGVWSLRQVPWIGNVMAFAFASIVNSYYLFEARWVKQGLTLSDRVKGLEQRYSYHLGFGFVITLISFWHSSMFVNLALFTLIFPIQLICASSSSTNPLPFTSMYPYYTENPNSSSIPSSSSASLNSFNETQPHHLQDYRTHFKANSFIPIQLPLLTVTAHLHSFIVHTLSPNSGAGKGATRERASRRKDVELEEMEGGGGGDADHRRLQGAVTNSTSMQSFPSHHRPGPHMNSSLDGNHSVNFDEPSNVKGHPPTSFGLNHDPYNSNSPERDQHVPLQSNSLEKQPSIGETTYSNMGDGMTTSTTSFAAAASAKDTEVRRRKVD